LYSTSPRSLLRGTPNPGQAEKNSLEKVVKLRGAKICFFAKVYPACKLLMMYLVEVYLGYGAIYICLVIIIINIKLTIVKLKI